MRNFITKLFFAAAVFVTPVVAQAQWTALSGVTLNNNGTPYWDNRSNDGANCNIGHVLTGVATHALCSSDRPNSGWLPVGSTDASDKVVLATDYYNLTSGMLLFTNRADLTVYGDIAGQNRGWGWFTSTTFVDLNSGPSTVLSGQTATIGLEGTPWGLWMDLTDGTRALSTGNQFAFFASSLGLGTPNPNSLRFGIEDINVNRFSDRDYNDVSGRLELLAGADEPPVSTVPEPSTYLMMAVGMTALAGYRKMKKNV